ncbi:MAG: protein-L-isoaspartate(D-aspartate) O-methyltransferase [Actinobacteria bacterium]|nr:protein-L-isoaspartate(D-aspartate) O-methyltransferase [Actinomycetota bacterium]
MTPARQDGPETAFALKRDALIDQLTAFGEIRDARVLDAMRRVPRHAFVRAEHLDEAYANHPLPIGEGQTISQPLVVAIMTEALALSPGDRVLEIGTGSGYQAAVLAELGVEVYSVEILPALATWARSNLMRAGHGGVQVLTADGYDGWREHAPYDAIIVTAAPDHIPSPLVRQLRLGGRLVIPVGPPGFYQTLWLLEQRADGLQSTNLGPVAFVPFTGQGAKPRGGE